MADTKRDVLDGIGGHTPGPWEVRPGRLVLDATYIGRSGFAGGEFARVFSVNKKADAHLIAAAPAMAGEIQEFREVVAGLLGLIDCEIPEDFREDHACRQCFPDGDIATDDFVCAYHRARALLPDTGIDPAWSERVIASEYSKNQGAEWDPRNPPYPVGSMVNYYGVPHKVVDAGEQGARLAAVRPSDRPDSGGCDE